MKTTIELIENFVKELPVFVPRKEVGELLNGIISPKTLANLDSLGEGPDRFKLNGKVFYPRDSFVQWLFQRSQYRIDCDINNEQGEYDEKK